MKPPTGRIRDDSDAVTAVEQAAAKGAVAQKLADHTHDDKHHGVAEALRDAVDGGGAHAVLIGERLSPAQNDTVDHNQRDKHAHGV